MTFFASLNLPVRLGIAFGALVVALAITTALSLNGLGKLDADAHELSERDVSALMELVTLSEDFLATDGDIVRHLYVEDGDLEAQDKRAEKIAAWTAEAAETLPVLERKLEGEAAKATLAEFTAAYEKFSAAGKKAVKLSRQKTADAVEERDGSRTTYLEEVLPALEGLDVFHDELEDDIAEQAAAQAAEGEATASTSRPASRPSVPAT
jgi:glutaredoxin 2